MCPPIHPYLYTGLLFHLTAMKQCLHSHNLQGGQSNSVCMCEGKPPCSSFSEVKSSWPLVQLWFQVCCAKPKLPTCVCHFCQQPLRHGGWNVPPRPLFLRVSLGLYTHSPISWATGGLSA